MINEPGGGAPPLRTILTPLCASIWLADNGPAAPFAGAGPVAGAGAAAGAGRRSIVATAWLASHRVVESAGERDQSGGGENSAGRQQRRKRGTAGRPRPADAQRPMQIVAVMKARHRPSPRPIRKRPF